MVGEDGLEGTLRHACRHGIRVQERKAPSHSGSRHGDSDGHGIHSCRPCLYVLDASASVWG